MAKQNINIGTTANSNTGDALRDAFIKVNANFTELYARSSFSGSYDDLLNKPTFATVSTTGSYNDLIDKPDLSSIGTASWANITDKPTFATVSTTGSYNDLLNKPAIPTKVSDIVNDLDYTTPQFLSENYYDKTSIDTLKADYLLIDDAEDLYVSQITYTDGLSTKQDTLVSGTNIKTINGQSLLGSGNILIEGGTGGGALATLSDVNLGVLDDNDILFYDANTSIWSGSSLKTINGVSLIGSGDIQISGTSMDATLDSVTSNGAITNNVLTVGGLVVTGTGISLIESQSDIELRAVNRVYVSNTPFRFASFTTSERDSEILTPQNGDTILNTTEGAIQTYINGSWKSMMVVV